MQDKQVKAVNHKFFLRFEPRSANYSMLNDTFYSDKFAYYKSPLNE